MHHALTVIGSSMTSTLHSHFAVSGLSITACATSRLVIRSTRPVTAGSVTSLPAVPSSFIWARYASFDAAVALSSDTKESCRRPVGLTAQALSSATPSSNVDNLPTMTPPSSDLTSLGREHLVPRPARPRYETSGVFEKPSAREPQRV